MKARVCDRCGSVIGTEKPDEENNDLDVYFVDEPELSLTDLCEKCKAEFSNLLVGYMAPYRGGKTVATQTDAGQKRAIEDADSEDANEAHVTSHKPTGDSGTKPESPVGELSETVTAHYPVRIRRSQQKPKGSLFD
jgi:hypothetical protein